MRWSQLKKRIEKRFADSCRGRIEVWTTRYREAHDEEGEAWITIDGKRAVSFGTCTYYMETHRETQRHWGVSSIPECFGPYEDPPPYWKTWDELSVEVAKRGILPLWDVNYLFFTYLSLSVDKAIHSESPLIRALAVIDRRFGKRRLRQFDASNEEPLVRLFYEFRCEAEGIRTAQDPAGSPGDTSKEA